MLEKYEPVMGLEIHARLKTKTKMFCNCSNDTWKAQPNEHTCPVCMGFPGALPVANTQAIYLGRKMGLALGCSLRANSKFDRKSYFYPDLPSGFQISQYDEPVAENGKLKIIVNGEAKYIRINRLHLENDAGKLTHVGENSLVDWNRAGSPLAEMVTEADFRSPEEVSAFLKELQRILRLLDISDADMEKGMMRCDVNVSVRPRGQEKFGTKVEIKNMNSFRFIEKALYFEIDRQIHLYETGKQSEIIQETRGYDSDKNKTFSQRSKEEAMDYRYFPEPDLPPLTITEEEIQSLKAEIPELPADTILKYINAGLSFVEAEIIVNDEGSKILLEGIVAKTKDYKKSANWVLGDMLSYRNEHEDFIATPHHIENIALLISMVESGEISNKIAKDIFKEVIESGKSPKQLVDEKGLGQISDTGAIETICAEVIAENPKVIEEIKAGKDRAFGSLVGQVMKKSGGKVNPSMANDVLKRLIG